jgi:hypothetical protein
VKTNRIYNLKGEGFIALLPSVRYVMTAVLICAITSINSMTTDPQTAPDEPDVLVLDFKKGTT